MNLKKSNYLEIIFVIGLFIIANIISQAMQKPITYQNGKGWDGVEYYRTAEQLTNHTYPKAGAPFVYRIGTPFLVSLFFKNDLLLGLSI